MKNIPNPNVGDKIAIYFYGEDRKATVIGKGKISNPRFNTWTAIMDYNKEKMEVSWNPMAEAFTDSSK